jgi:hypothetical protein
MRELQQKLPRKQRLARLQTWVEEAEGRAARLRRKKDVSIPENKALAWAFAKALTEARALKQAEAIGRLHLAFEPLIVTIPTTIQGFYLLSDKMKQYDQCRRACKRTWRNRILRNACITYCIAQLLRCMKPDESPN